MTDLDLIEEAIGEYWGERCPDYDEYCRTCKAWRQFDAARAALPKGEPVAWQHRRRAPGGEWTSWLCGRADYVPSTEIEERSLFAAPPAAPEGWKLAPVEPTEAMIEAGDDLVPVARGTETYRMSGRAYPEDIYRAMIAAAPPAGDER